MLRFQKLLMLLFGLVIFSSCEEEYLPEDVFTVPQVVVEGFIESGTGALPPYVILTKSSPYLATLSPQELNNLFVHNARIEVTDGQASVTLTEVCLGTIASLDSTLAQIVAESVGFGDVDISQLNYCVYVDLFGFLGLSSINPQEGGVYHLNVYTDEDTLRASTRIPPFVPMDSVFVVDHPDFPENDSLVELRSIITDPPGIENYYRLFTQRNEEPMYPLLGGSVTDDKIFDGQQFQFPIQRGQPVTAELDVNTFGYFWRGDTIALKAACIDYAHFRFWQTLEYNVGTQGPFSSYVRIESNVGGGLGIWGGISSDIYELIVP